MEYWEFLLQKEGDRSWLPIKLPKIEIEEGRYRVVAHSSRPNMDVEISVTHDSTEEVPPKRRYQKRSRRTNAEGLMVVIPFTSLKPGFWELRCGGDIMSDFLGNSWQHNVQLQVLPKVTEVKLNSELISPAVDAPQTPIPTKLHSKVDRRNKGDKGDKEEKVIGTTVTSYQADLSQNLPSSSEADRGVELEPVIIESFPRPLIEIAAEYNPDQGVEPEPLKIETPPVTPLTAEAAVQEPEIPVKGETNVDEAESGIATLEEDDTVVPLELVDSNDNNSEFTSNRVEEASPTNPILDKSLQMLEQILQQVLEPVLQDFERTEAPELKIEEDLEQSLETDTPEQCFILTLNEDALVARRGELLTIAGTVDVSDVNQGDRTTTSDHSNVVFQGTLRYELRDPQSLQVLLDVQQPLSEQALPLSFSHTLEIPPDYNTRLILGKVTLYGSTSAALANQPFSISADLDELLEAIIPGSQVMPVAKMLVLANNPTAFQDNEAEPSQSGSPPLDQALLDLINAPESRQPLSLQPIPSKRLPPKISLTPHPQRLSKPLHLPDFPKIKPVATNTQFSDVLNTAKNIALELGLQEATQQPEEIISVEDSVPVTDSSPIALGETELSDSPVLAVNPTSNSLETPVVSASTTHSKVDSVPNGNGSAMVHDALGLAKQQDVSVGDSETLATSVVQSLGELSSPQQQNLNAQKSYKATDLTPTWEEATDGWDADTSDVDSPSSNSDATQLWEVPEPELSSAEVPVSESATNGRPELDNAFQALKIQDRFWFRLNCLAVDAELLKSLNSETSPSSDSADVEEATQQPNSEQLLVDFDESMWEEESDDLDSAQADSIELQPPLLDVAKIDWTAQEIVVDDEELPILEQPEVRDRALSQANPAAPIGSQPEQRIPFSRQLELPLPAPTLFIPTSELASGETVTVRAKLPPHPARLCIKLWVQDRQSRSLLDGPRWLVDLIPDGAGQLEAMTQLTVPFGSVEIRFEAIAIDLDSQQESHKVGIDCVVVSPDFPSFSLDDF